jgi:hypothetical protein
MLRLKDSEVVDTCWTEPTHGLDAFERAEPVEYEKGFVWADAEDAAASEFEEVKRVVGRE